MTSRSFYFKALALGACAILASCSGTQTTSLPPAQPANTSTVRTAAAKDSATITNVHSFNAGLGDASHPMGDLINVGGTLYGTASDGGANKQGAVYALNPDGSERVVYSFKGGSDGQYPYAGLTNINGTLYGTTTLGGTSTCGGYAEGCGVVYSVSTGGQEKVLHLFKGSPDGSHPWAALTVVNGVLYGTTFQGGGHNAGTVFSITTSGTMKTLHAFSGAPDGANPTAAMTNVAGILFGATEMGGRSGCYFKSGCGTVFTMATSGAEKVLYAFTGGPDGNYPTAGLLNQRGTLYGSASAGGPKGCGSIFSITTAGKEQTLHTFPGTGVCSVTTRLTAANGAFYGTSGMGGTANAGTIFSVTTGGQVKLLYSFGGGTKGLYPETALTNVNSKLFGATFYGGSGRGCGSNACGFVFSYAP